MRLTALLAGPARSIVSLRLWLTRSGNNRSDGSALPDSQRRLARILVSFDKRRHHFATFTLKVTVLAPPAFLMTNLYCPSFFGVTLTEHFGPGESSLATCSPEES